MSTPLTPLTPLEQLSPQLRKEQFFTTAEQGESQLEYIVMLGRALHMIKIRCGETDPSFYEQEAVIGALKKFLGERAGKLRIICGKEAEDLEGARQLFMKENLSLWLLYVGYPGQVGLWWAPKRPENHYTIIDAREVFVEARHGKAEPRATLFRFDADFAKKMEERFDNHLANLKDNRL